ncbi:MAG: class I SAM-dependent methyltransferase [Patescibacteria group bacterium]
MQTFKKLLKKLLGEDFYQRHKRNAIIRVLAGIVATIEGGNLKFLAHFFNTDKSNSHNYTPIYEQHFRNLRFRRLKILEIGIGGHRNLATGGASLRMWKYFFPYSMIYGIDKYEKQSVEERRIKIFTGDQGNPEFLRQVYHSTGTLNVVIDDGSHKCSDVITSFKTLFPILVSGGVYVVEDTHTSYIPKFGGDPHNLNSQTTSMGFFKSLADSLHFEDRIASLHFYHNMVFIYKK